MEEFLTSAFGSRKPTNSLSAGGGPGCAESFWGCMVWIGPGQRRERESERGCPHENPHMGASFRILVFFPSEQIPIPALPSFLKLGIMASPSEASSLFVLERLLCCHLLVSTVQVASRNDAYIQDSVTGKREREREVRRATWIEMSKLIIMSEFRYRKAAAAAARVLIRDHNHSLENNY
ncbi:hypothetical protein H6P81_018295 [Aristolochia fimbriata]|uniref:Uncharacterized protein n=1 Tax=Aristolochia fimbriata TaxID=158543 RepID=A0AAV7E3U3_ARIFI|nr:hypothetical protein H6P81_018295 [Aristolochia fimbriata]